MKKRKSHKHEHEHAASPGTPEHGTAPAAMSSSAPARVSEPAAAAPRAPAPVVVREIGDEPRASRYSVPTLLIALLGALLFWADMHIVNHGGGLNAKVFRPYVSTNQLDSFRPKDEETILALKGKAVYDLTCSPCHQADGNGSASQNAPPLVASEWVLEKDPARLIRIVLNGLSGPITVKGKEWGLGVMPPWRDALTDEQIALALTYTRNTWGNKAPAVKPEQVKKVREETKDHVGAMTVADLLKVTLQP
jgi:mono/diheme cytochrome c family protein